MGIIKVYFHSHNVNYRENMREAFLQKVAKPSFGNPTFKGAGVSVTVLSEIFSLVSQFLIVADSSKSGHFPFFL